MTTALERKAGRVNRFINKQKPKNPIHLFDKKKKVATPVAQKKKKTPTKKKKA